MGRYTLTISRARLQTRATTRPGCRRPQVCWGLVWETGELCLGRGECTTSAGHWPFTKTQPISIKLIAGGGGWGVWGTYVVLAAVKALGFVLAKNQAHWDEAFPDLSLQLWRGHGPAAEYAGVFGGWWFVAAVVGWIKGRVGTQWETGFDLPRILWHQPVEPFWSFFLYCLLWILVESRQIKLSNFKLIQCSWFCPVAL